MTVPRKRGRRDNGLDAAAFRAVSDVDPRVGEHLLDVLRDAGIAAYLDPTSDVDAVTRSIALPSPPSDRLYVDRNQAGAARTLIADYDLDDEPDDRARPGAARALAGPTSPTTPSTVEDVQWQALIAAYERDHGRLGDTLTDKDATAIQAQAQQHEASVESAALTAEVEEEEHYEPPPPPPLPALSKAAGYALALLAGGVLLLVAPGLVGLGPEFGFVSGVLAIAAGVGMLVWRMREGPRYDDPDDGAIV